MSVSVLPDTIAPAKSSTSSCVSVVSVKPSDEVATHVGALDPLDWRMYPLVPALPLKRRAPVWLVSPAVVSLYPGVVVPMPMLPAPLWHGCAPVVTPSWHARVSVAQVYWVVVMVQAVYVWVATETGPRHRRRVLCEREVRPAFCVTCTCTRMRLRTGCTGPACAH